MGLPLLGLLGGAGIGAGILDVMATGGRNLYSIAKTGLEAFGKGQQEAARNTALHSTGALLDVIGKAVDSIPFLKWLSEPLRSLGQEWMGIPENQRTYGSATRSYTAQPETTGSTPSSDNAPNAPATPQQTSALRVPNVPYRSDFAQAVSPDTDSLSFRMRIADAGPTTIPLNATMPTTGGPRVAPSLDELRFDALN